MKELTRRDFLKLAGAAAVGGVALACSPLEGLRVALGGLPTTPAAPTPNWEGTVKAPTAVPTARVEATATNTASARVAATVPAVKPAVTVDSMLHEAAVNYAGKVNRPVDEVEKMMKAMFQSVTAQHMPFLSASTKGLVPNETQARSFKEFKKGETLTVEASTRGYYEISGGYFTGNVNGVTVDYPWRDKRTVHLFFMAPLDKEAKINITDIAAGGAYGIGASYGYDQVSQYGGQSRTMIDPIRVADGLTQAMYRDGIADGQNGPAQEVVAFVDTITGQITEYTFTNKTGGWQKTK